MGGAELGGGSLSERTCAVFFCKGQANIGFKLGGPDHRAIVKIKSDADGDYE
jgi:hypothetical protein